MAPSLWKNKHIVITGSQLAVYCVNSRRQLLEFDLLKSKYNVQYEQGQSKLLASFIEKAKIYDFEFSDEESVGVLQKVFEYYRNHKVHVKLPVSKG